ncbi:MAG: phasin family protein [Arenibacterium sp.]
MADDKSSNPFLDMFQDFGRSLNIPGPDMNDIMDHHRKNLQALQAAAQVGSSSAQELMNKQREVLESTLAEISENIQNATAGADPSDMMAGSMDMAKKSFDAALKNATEMSEIIQQGNADAFNVFRDRMMESIEELTGKKSG